MKKGFVYILGCALLAMLMTASLLSQPYISLQGVLKDGSGDLLTDGNYSIEFNFYTSLAGGSSVWSETQTVGVSEGVFSAHLGSVSALSISFENQYWVGVSVEGEPELSPRIMLTYSPYAMYAVAIADDAVTSDKIADGTITAADLSSMGATAGQNLSWNGTSWQPATSSVGASNLDDLSDASRDYSKSNLYLGHEIGVSNTGSGNTAVGISALVSNTSGASNTASGKSALSSNTTGGANTASGQHALSSNTTGEGNTAQGRMALYNNTIGNYNTASGAYALRDNTEGDYNTATGANSLASNADGHHNTANGYNSLSSNTLGIHNTASGAEALFSNISGSYNTATGFMALRFNTTGNNNTANGYYALYNNTNGYYNMAIGDRALYSNTTGIRNSASSPYALSSNTTGSYNTAVGYSSGSIVDSNYQCTFLGYEADNHSSVSHSGSMALGALSRITQKYQVRIGHSSITQIGGFVGWTTLSDGRFKTDVAEEVPGMAFISKLRPVTYHMKVRELNRFLNIPDSLLSDERSQAGIAKKESIKYTGFIAQEVEEAARSVGFDFSGVDAPQNDESTYGLRYAEFVVPLVQAMQEQQAVIENYRAENQELRQEMMEIRSELDELKRLIITAGENKE